MILRILNSSPAMPATRRGFRVKPLKILSSVHRIRTIDGNRCNSESSYPLALSQSVDQRLAHALGNTSPLEKTLVKKQTNKIAIISNRLAIERLTSKLAELHRVIPKR